MRLRKFGVPLNIVLHREPGCFALQDQILYQIKDMILTSRLKAGDMLPPSRLLCSQLNVSRGTVSAVYKMLADEGLVATQVGKGTIVLDLQPAQKIHGRVDIPGEAGRKAEPRSNEEPHVAGERQERFSTTYFVQKKIPFAVNCPDYESVPGKRWMQLVGRHSKSPWMNNGYSPAEGYAPFREAIAHSLRTRRGISCDASQIIAVNNVQQGLALAAQVLFEPGSRVLVENPGYDLHRDTLRYFGLVPEAVNITDNGLQTADLPAVHPDARGILVTPSNQYPLGRVMSMQTRKDLIAWAVETGAWIIEDDVDNELIFSSGSPLPALAGLHEDAPVVHLGSFANTIYPGIVVGYMAVPKALAGRFKLAKLFNDRQVSEVHAAIFTDYIRMGFYDSHLRKLSRLYESRCQALAREADRLLAPWGRLASCRQGTHAVFYFKKPLDDVRLVQKLRAGWRIEARALSSAYLEPVDGRIPSGLILGFAGFTEEKIQHACGLLAQAFGELIGPM